MKSSEVTSLTASPPPGSPSVQSATATRAMASKPRRESHYGDQIFGWALKVPAAGIVVTLCAIVVYLWKGAGLAIHKFGWSFIASSVWDPVQENFGALPVIYGTVVSSLLAVCIAAPLSVGAALFLTEILPPKPAAALGFLIEMLAAIPSVVYGLWGIFVLAPILRSTIEPALSKSLGALPVFSGPPYGVGMLAAGIILAIMIAPTITSISREVFRAIPRDQREGALALGSTHWEMIRLAVLKGGRSGVFGAIVLGLGRALGETMAVTMVIGNRSAISASLLAPAQTMASVIANEYAEATSDIHLSALAEVGLVLFVVTLLINGFAKFVIHKTTKRARA